MFAQDELWGFDSLDPLPFILCSLVDIKTWSLFSRILTLWEKNVIHTYISTYNCRLKLKHGGLNENSPKRPTESCTVRRCGSEVSNAQVRPSHFLFLLPADIELLATSPAPDLPMLLCFLP